MGEIRGLFYSAGVADPVEKFLRSLLRDGSFQLDGEDSRRYLVFNNGAYGREADTFVEKTPAIMSSHCAGWTWGGSGLTSEEEAEVEAALALVSADDSWVSDEARAA